MHVRDLFLLTITFMLAHCLVQGRRRKIAALDRKLQRFRNFATRLTRTRGNSADEHTIFDNRRSGISKDLLFLDNGYALAFRLTAGIGHNSFEKYTAVGRNDDADGLTLAGVPCGCLTVNGSLPCDRHFRSRLLDAWPASLIDRVRVSVYNDGVEEAFLEFDAAGTTYLDFFRQERIVAASYSSTETARFNRFSIEGIFSERNLQRQTYTNFVSNRHCLTEAGYLTVFERGDGCDFTIAGNYPLVIYSVLNTIASYANEDEVSRADVLTVSVKFKRNADLNQRCSP